jgi:hypothetical protein
MAAGLTVGLDWEALGAEASPAVSAAHAILVTGKDPIAAARAALGIGRAQSRTRRVAIGDLVGEVEPLQSLVTGDDPHGIVDSFLYGVSLNKIARQVDESGTLFVMPSGTEPVVTPDILRNERWSRLAAGFREVGALLVLVASSDADGVHELASMLDGVVVVGDAASVLSVPRNSVLAHVDAPPVVPAPPELIEAAAASAPRGGQAASKPSPVLLPAQDVVEKRVLTPFPAQDRRKQGMIAGAIVVALLVAWYAYTRFSAPPPAAGVATPATSAVNIADSAAGTPAPNAAATTPPMDSAAAARVANPQDSLKAAAFGVVIVATNDEAQALARWADLGLSLPAGTVTMVRIRGERGRFFQMQAGAYGKARQADSLLGALRASGKLKADAGRVVATPFGLMLESKVSRRAAQNVADGYGQRQIAAYPLLQADGSATIFVGAFESPEQAIPLMAELKAKGVGSTLYYRTGRSF